MNVSANKNKIVFVGMSGGVDSSVAALLLKKQGYDVVGVFMRCYNLDGCAERDAEDARRVAEHIGIPFYVWDFEEEYKKQVVEYMIEGYRAGITPNPDVMCNREIKFGLFLQKALAAGADYVATGHYVRIQRGHKTQEKQRKQKIQRKSRERKSPMYSLSLRVARDAQKDQSYFLWTLTQDDLKHCLFPIGDYIKPRVRAIAAKAGLPTAAKKDSQGICFLGNVNVNEFLQQYIPVKKGVLMTTTGEIIGEHHGAEFYTIGERHIKADFHFPKTGARKDREPFYVAGKNLKTNTVTVAEGEQNPALYRKEIELTGVNFLGDKKNIKDLSGIFARVRYRQPLSKAVLRDAEFRIQNPESRIQNVGFRIQNAESRIQNAESRMRNAKSRAKKELGSLKLIFNKPQKFVASGQSAVFYDKDGVMLGGGVIV